MNQKNNNQETLQHWSHLGRTFLNSMIGDYLAKENNPLAIKMGFYHQYKRLRLDKSLPRQMNIPISNKVVVFVHGLTDMETIWHYPTAGRPSDELVGNYIKDSFDGARGLNTETYGRKLHEQFGYTPFFLRYNSGLSSDKNGREFATQLSRLFSTYPIKIDELMLIGFNMGGLLIRQAQATALQHDLPWLKTLSKCIYLGEAREFSPVERVAHFSREIMQQAATHHRLNWLENQNKRLEQLSHKLPFLSPKIDTQLNPNHFTDSARHYFVYGGLNHSQNETNTRTPIHGQNAYFEGLAEKPLAHTERVYQHVADWVRQDEQSETYKATRPKTRMVHYTNYETDNTSLLAPNQALIAGAIDFLASTYDKTLENIETMHYAMAEEPFSAMQKLPIASQMAEPVEKIHRGTLNLVYRSLRSGGKLAHKTAKAIAPPEKKAFAQDA